MKKLAVCSKSQIKGNRWSDKSWSAWWTEKEQEVYDIEHNCGTFSVVIRSQHNKDILDKGNDSDGVDDERECSKDVPAIRDSIRKCTFEYIQRRSAYISIHHSQTLICKAQDYWQWQDLQIKIVWICYISTYNANLSFAFSWNKPIPEDLWTLKLENFSLRMPEGKQQSQTVAAAHNTYRDRLYLKNTATNAKEFQFVHCRFALPDIHQFSLCRTVFLSIECFGIRYELPQKEPSQIPILNTNTRGFTTDRQSRNCTSRCGFFLFHSFSQSNLIQASRELNKLRQKKALFKEEFGEAKFWERMDLAPITNAHAPSGTACCARGRLPVPEVYPWFDPSSKAFPGHVHSLIPSPDLPPSSPLLLLPLACHSPAPLLRCLLCSKLVCCSWASSALVFFLFFWLLAIIQKRNEPNLAIDLTIKQIIRKKKDSCPVLATNRNSLSKYGDL